MFYVVLALLFVAFAGLLLITALRVEANSRVITHNSELLQRLEEKLAKEPEDRPAIAPPECVAVSAPIEEAELQAIPRRPPHETLISGLLPDRAIIPNEPPHDLLEEAEDHPTTVLPRCAKCGSVDYVATGGLFRCNSCKKVGYLQIPHEREVA